MDFLGSHEVQSFLAIFFNAFPALIFLCILITLPALRSKGKNYRQFFVTVLFGILACAGECLSYMVELYWHDHLLAVISGFLDFLFVALFRAAEAVFVLNYVDSGLKLNKLLKRIAFLTQSVVFFMLAVPPLARQVYFFAEDGYLMGYGSLYELYCCLQMLVIACLFVAILANRSVLGTKATVALTTIQAVGIISNFLVKNQAVLVLPATSLVILIFYISIYQGSILAAAEQEKEFARQSLELADIKTKAMLSQVKPHFIYNTLSSIATLCTRDPAKAKELTLDFSEYLRNNLDTLGRDGISVCSFAEELEHIRTYLAIEEVRFGDRLKLVYDIREDDFCIPALSIQPIVENAVKHGICHKKGGGTVTISSDRTESGYRITVRDDGAGFDREEALNDGNVHIGIANIEKRITAFGGTVTIESAEGRGTTVTVQLPGQEEPV